MGKRRVVDTSSVFSAFTSPKDEDTGIAVQSDAENESIAQEATAPAAEIVEEPVAATNPTSKNKTKSKKTSKPAKPAAAKESSGKTLDPRDKQSTDCKRSFYLTPRVYDALQLYKAIHFMTSHKDSSIVNAALTAYLSKEIEALRSVDETLSESERLAAAASLLR